jgi:hypothetical protein
LAFRATVASHTSKVAGIDIRSSAGRPNREQPARMGGDADK